MLFTIFLIAFALFAIVRVVRQYSQQKTSQHWAILWTLLWLGVVVVAIIPKSTDVVASLVGVERGADLIVYVSVVVLFYGLYRAMVRQERQAQEITQLVRRLAIVEKRREDQNAKI